MKLIQTISIVIVTASLTLLCNQAYKLHKKRSTKCEKYTITKHGDYTQLTAITISNSSIVHAMKQVIKDRELCNNKNVVNCGLVLDITSKDQAINYTFELVQDYGFVYLEEILAAEKGLDQEALSMFNNVFKTNFDEQIL